MLDRAEVLDRFPLLASDLRPGKDLEALLTASADGHWRAVATAVTDGDESCKGWARWRLHRGRDGSQALSGCTTGELPGSGALPAVSFVPALQGSPLLVAVPADTCRYELLEPEGGARHGHVVPVFGNGVRIERIANGLVAVHSTDWYGGTLAYQLQAPGSGLSGPVFMLADRDDGVGDLGKKANHAPGVRTLFDTRMTAQEHSTGIAAAFAPDGHTLAIRAQGSTTTLGVPPWGQRLRDRLRQAVRARAEKASSSP
jgi:hypothetical protein